MFQLEASSVPSPRPPSFSYAALECFMIEVHFVRGRVSSHVVVIASLSHLLTQITSFSYLFHLGIKAIHPPWPLPTWAFSLSIFPCSSLCFPLRHIILPPLFLLAPRVPHCSMSNYYRSRRRFALLCPNPRLSSQWQPET